MARIGLWVAVCLLRVGAAAEARQRLDSPRFNWKSGLNSECSAEEQLVDEEFIKAHEGFRLEGVVPCEEAELDHCEFGVLIGIDVDLGSKSADFFKDKLRPDDKLDNQLLCKLTPYFGLKGRAARDKSKAQVLYLLPEEELRLRQVIFDLVLAGFVEVYERNRDKSSTVEFRKMPFAVRTAIFDFVYEDGRENHPKLAPEPLRPLVERAFQCIIDNDFRGLSTALRSLGEESPHYTARRRDEADLIDSAFVDCDRVLDIFFVVDESSSIGRDNFEEAKDLIIEFLRNFSNKATRVGVVMFDTTPTVVHPLDYLSNAQAIINDVRAHQYGSGSTQTGLALKFTLSNIKRNRRADTEGVSPLIFLLTDGKADDNVIEPAQMARDQKVIITAIGIGSTINFSELADMAWDASHVLQFADYQQLKCNVKKLKAESCLQQNFVEVEKPVETAIAGGQVSYYAFEVEKSRGLIVKLTKNASEPAVEMFVSTADPNPDSIQREIWHSGEASSDQEITITYPQALATTVASARRARNSFAVNPVLTGFWDWVFEWFKKAEDVYRKPIDDNEFDFGSKRKKSEGNKYNVYLALKSHGVNDTSTKYKLETDTCAVGDPLCVNSSNELDIGPRFPWVRLAVVGVCLVAFWVIMWIVFCRKTQHDDAFGAYVAQ